MRKKNNQTNLLVRLFLLVCLLIVSLNTKADSGAWYFNESKYFSIFTIAWTRFDASMAPTGTDGIYLPEFVK